MGYIIAILVLIILIIIIAFVRIISVIYNRLNILEIEIQEHNEKVCELITNNRNNIKNFINDLFKDSILYHNKHYNDLNSTISIESGRIYNKINNTNNTNNANNSKQANNSLENKNIGKSSTKKKNSK